MGQINAVYGQSLHDINLQVYGNLDNFVKLMNDNNITSSSINPPPSVVIYDPTIKNINNNFTNNPYCTKKIAE